MATCNFYNENCSRYFVIGMNRYYTKEDVEECDLDPQLEGEFDEFGTEADYAFSKQNIVSGLRKKGWQDYDGYEGDARVIAYKDKTLVYGGCEISLEIKALEALNMICLMMENLARFPWSMIIGPGTPV